MEVDDTNVSCSNDTGRCNITETAPDDNDPFEGYLPRAIFQLTLFVIETLAGLLGNGIIVCLIVARKRLRTVCNFYILNRAVSDILLQLPNLLLFVTTARMSFVFGREACIFTAVLIQISALVGNATLVLMSVDCYLSTRQGHHAPTFRAKLLKISLFVVWIIGASLSKVIIGFQPYHEQREQDGKETRAYCLPGPFFYAPQAMLYIASTFVAFIVPLTLIWVFVGMSFQPKSRDVPYINRNDSLSEQGSGGGEGDDDIGEGELEPEADYRKRFIVALSVLFTVCQLSFWSATVAHVHEFNLYLPFVYEGAATLLDLNAALNPVFYVLFAKDIYQEFVKLLPTHKSAGDPLQAVYSRHPQST